jgi:hypothetical protein
MKALMRGLIGMALLTGLAGAAEAGPRSKQHRYYQGHSSGAAERGNGYYERLADKLPFGSSIWWEQMMRERRGGRPG